MKRLANFFVVSLSLCVASSFAHSARYWPPTLTEWSLLLNNDVAYVSSPQFATHCLYSRGLIGINGTEFNKALLAYAMAAKAKGKNLRYVVDDTQTTCIITGLEEVD